MSGRRFCYAPATWGDDEELTREKAIFLDHSQRIFELVDVTDEFRPKPTVTVDLEAAEAIAKYAIDHAAFTEGVGRHGSVVMDACREVRVALGGGQS